MFTFSSKPKRHLKKDDDGSVEDIPNAAESTSVSSHAINPPFSAAFAELQLSTDNMDMTFRDITEQTVFKGSAELNGNPFTIRDCVDSVLVLLDHTATITIEQCTNCVIICGPCRGSIFMRNCSNCLLLAACQQFRLQNSRDVETHLHCTTKPTIEDSDLIVAPLLMSYSGFNDDMASARLDKGPNLWDKVQNFTPNTGQFQVMPFDPFANGAIGSEVVSDELLEKLTTFMEKPEAQDLLLGLN